MMDFSEFYFKHQNKFLIIGMMGAICIFLPQLITDYIENVMIEVLIFGFAFTCAMGFVVSNEIFNNRVKFSEEYKKGKKFFEQEKHEKGEHNTISRRRKFNYIKENSKTDFKFHCFIKGYNVAKKKDENAIVKVITESDKKIDALFVKVNE